MAAVHGGGTTRFFHNVIQQVEDRRGRVEYLRKLNRDHANEFTSDEAMAARRLYKLNHPTKIGAFKCMDGRVHLPSITQVPLGVIHSWRNLGGQFELGWPFCGHDVRQWVERATQQAKPCLFLVTYHFSRGDKCRGCAGFRYDTSAAITYTRQLKEQIERVFGRDDRSIYPVQVGIETDTDSLVLHGENGEVFDCGVETGITHTSLYKTLACMYPKMPLRIMLDFAPLILGNMEHVKNVRAEERPIAQREHREWVLGIGRGFEWLNVVNRALIVGPFSPNLDEPIVKAAGIIENNMHAGRIHEDGFVLLTSASHRDSTDVNVSLAEEESRFLFRFAVEAIGNTHPLLLEKMVPMVVTVNMTTRVLRMVKS